MQDQPESAGEERSPAQPLSCFPKPTAIGWALVGAFPVARWHDLRCLLGKKGILSRIGDSTDETGHTIELLVPVGHLAYARQLIELRDSLQGAGVEQTHGFPVIRPGSSAEKIILPAIPINECPPPGLTPQQIGVQNNLMAIAWAVLIGLLMLIAAILLLA
jgi:hypothetical protein